MITVIKACRREVDALPLEIREDLADALARLDEGLSLSMPLSRPMPSIGPGVHELRLKDRSEAYRIIYFLWKQQNILLCMHLRKPLSRPHEELLK